MRDGGYGFGPDLPGAARPRAPPDGRRPRRLPWARLLNALLFALAAVPVYLLARRLAPAAAGALACAALAVAAPVRALHGLRDDGGRRVRRVHASPSSRCRAASSDRRSAAQLLALAALAPRGRASGSSSRRSASRSSGRSSCASLLTPAACALPSRDDLVRLWPLLVRPRRRDARRSPCVPRSGTRSRGYGDLWRSYDLVEVGALDVAGARGARPLPGARPARRRPGRPGRARARRPPGRRPGCGVRLARSCSRERRRCCSSWARSRAPSSASASSTTGTSSTSSRCGSSRLAVWAERGGGRIAAGSLAVGAALTIASCCRDAAAVPAERGRRPPVRRDRHGAARRRSRCASAATARRAGARRRRRSSPSRSRHRPARRSAGSSSSPSRSCSRQRRARLGRAHRVRAEHDVRGLDARHTAWVDR